MRSASEFAGQPFGLGLTEHPSVHDTADTLNEWALCLYEVTIFLSFKEATKSASDHPLLLASCCHSQGSPSANSCRETSTGAFAQA